jgi:MFS family permease
VHASSTRPRTGPDVVETTGDFMVASNFTPSIDKLRYVYLGYTQRHLLWRTSPTWRRITMVNKLSSAAEADRVLQHPRAWSVVALLAFANLLNFYDRTLPSIVAEQVRLEYGLSDTQLGLLMSGFTVVYAVSGIVIGRMADRRSRRVIMGLGLVAWSLMTAASGGAWSFASLLLFRLGVGIGEASFAPSANATIFRIFPADKRSRAVAVFQFGLPLGMLVAFFTTGPIIEYFDSWRAPFFIAAVPGALLGVYMLITRNTALESTPAIDNPHSAAPAHPIRTVLRIPTIWWLTVAGIGLQVASYGIATFIVPLLQRYFGLSLTTASMGAGLILGLAGLIGLALGGVAADRASRVSSPTRLLVGGAALIAALPFTIVAFTVSPDSALMFVVLMTFASVLINMFNPVAIPVIAEVVGPRLHATAIAVFFGAFYLLGGAFGPVIIGALSGRLADAAAQTDGLSPEAIGLHASLSWILPVAIVLLAVGVLGAARTVERDKSAMRVNGVGQ